MLHSSEIVLVQGVEYTLKVYRKRTRSFSYRIHPERISITLPLFYTNSHEIERYKAEWTQYAIDRILSDKKLQTVIPFRKWDSISICGREYGVSYHEDTLRNRFNPHTNTFEVRHDISQEKIKSIFAKFIQTKFEDYITERVHTINRQTIQKSIRSVSVRHHHSKWGSCSSEGDITLSVNTLLTPLWVIDYVIVHELCHLVEMNHSKNFWLKVKQYYPKYKLAVDFLKNHGLNYSL